MTAKWNVRMGQLGEKVPLFVAPRVSATIVCACLAPAELFLDNWEERIPKAFMDAIDRMILPCDDLDEPGKPGAWCRDCVFGDVTEEASDEQT